jgi:hypothetical protein
MLHPRAAPLLAVGLSIAATLGWLALSAHTSSGGRLTLVLLAVGAYGLVLTTCQRSPVPPSRGIVLAASAVLLVGAVLLPPRDSNDVWGYVSYARVLTEHGANPYVDSPSDHPDDALYHRMSEEYRTTPTIYGPVFTAVSVVGTAASGDHALANRIFFQLLAAAAAIAALGLVDRRTRGDPGALALLGLGPPVAAMVNGAHPDLLIGTLVLGAVVVARRGRPALVGLVLGAAVLVKLVAVLPAAGVVAWTFRRWGLRAATVTGGAVAAAVAVAYSVVGGLAALEPVREARLFASRGQAWEIVRARWSDAWAAEGIADAAELAHADVSRLALPIVAVLVLVALWRWSERPDPAEPATAAGLAYLLAAPYVLPWYSGWVLPAAATVRRSPVTTLAVLQSCLVLVVYADPPGRLPDEDSVLFDLSTRWLPVAGIALGVAFVVVAFLTRRGPPEGSPVGEDGTGSAREAVGVS